MPEKEKLFDNFPPVSTEEWMNKVKTDLKGRDFEKKLIWKTPEGIDVQPFYREEDIAELQFLNNPPGEFPYLRGIYPGKNEWYIRQDITVTDPRHANKKALEILNKGVNSLGFVFGEDAEFTEEFMETLLYGIFCESIEINLRPGGKAKELFESFHKVLKKRGVRTDCVKGSIEADPIGKLAANGSLCIPVKEGIDYISDLVKAAEVYENFRVISIGGDLFDNAGADIVQQLSFALAMGCEYMSQLTDRGISADKAASSIGFTLGIGSNYFMEISKIRAARVLWAKIVEAFSPDDINSSKIYIHSVTSEWNKTIYDPYVNMLRTQTEAMSATLGGTSSLTVRPFDSVFRESTELSERIARNQQLLLMEESYFGRVNDPAAGSYYIENLTASISENSWNLFVEIENEGGFLESLKKGLIQSRIKEAAEKKKINVRSRREKVLGTNIFPDANEKIKDITGKESHKEDKKNDFEPITTFRAAGEFEKLRMSVDALDNPPLVFLLTVGNPVMRKARAQFAHGFFGCAGYKIVDNPGFDDPETGLREALNMKSDIIVVCSSDDEYPEIIPRVQDLLNDKAILVVAGEPPCMDELKKSGVDHFISLRSNLYESLSAYNRELGINN